jgi:hypothetical protein
MKNKQNWTLKRKELTCKTQNSQRSADPRMFHLPADTGHVDMGHDLNFKIKKHQTEFIPSTYLDARPSAAKTNLVNETPCRSADH